MKRRNFLQAAAALSVPAFVPLSGVRANTSPFTSLIAPDSDRILIIIHLFGGNDGLNMLIPMDQMEGLSKVRHDFHIREGDALKLTDELAIHPNMDGMRGMFKDDRLKIIQSVGYPNQNRSHFRSTDIMVSGSEAKKIVKSGWIGRYLDDKNPGYPEGYPSSGQPDPPAISIGNVAHPTCEGSQINFSQTVTEPERIEELVSTSARSVPNDNYGSELDFVRTTIRQTNSYNSVIQKAYSRGRNKANYPGYTNALAHQLQKVARLIDGGLGTKVYTVYMSGFDTHANQVGSNPKDGTHARLLAEVSEAITVFQDDMVKLGHDERVLGMTFSEFGRRIKPNASRGTDHGTAGPMFLFGSCVTEGILGDNVDLSGDINQSDGVPMQFDFRDVYGSILVDWFDVSTSNVKRLLHDKFKYLPIAGSCNADTDTTSTGDEQTPDGWTIGQPFPNPTKDGVSISIASPGNNRLRYTLFDARGRMVLANEIAVSGSGEYTLFSRPSRLPSGTYVLRLATETGSTLSRKVVFN